MRLYSEMMEETVAVTALEQNLGTNVSQLKVVAKLPPGLLQSGSALTPEQLTSATCTLIPLSFAVHFAGYLGTFRFRALLAVKAMASMEPSQHDAFCKMLGRHLTVAQRSSYRCSTNEPVRERHGSLAVDVVRASGLPQADVAIFGQKSDPFCVLQIVSSGNGRGVHRSSSLKTSIKLKTCDPVWNEQFTFEVHDATHDVLRIDVIDYDKGSTDDKIGWVELPVYEVVTESHVHQDHAKSLTLIPYPPFKTAGSIDLRLALTLLDVSDRPVSEPAINTHHQPSTEVAAPANPAVSKATIEAASAQSVKVEAPSETALHEAADVTVTTASAAVVAPAEAAASEAAVESASTPSAAVAAPAEAAASEAADATVSTASAELDTAAEAAASEATVESASTASAAVAAPAEAAASEAAVESESTATPEVAAPAEAEES
jgi:hypothetical protein